MQNKIAEKNLLHNNKFLYVFILLIYAVLTFIGVINHEIWFDEAQAWVIARDNDIPGIIEQLGYEGHPPLWYLILYMFSHAGFSCNILNIISFTVSLAAVSIILFCAPFKLWVKCAVIFSGGFLYFNSVISRTYCLIELFLVIIAVLYPKRKSHPIAYGLTVAGLANTHVCVSGFIGIIGIYMIYDLIKDFKSNTKKQNISEIIGLIISGIGVICLVLPLLGATEKCRTTNNNSYTVLSVLQGFVEFPYVVSERFLFSESELNPININIIMINTVLSIVFIILQRHKTRSVILILVSHLFFAVSSYIIWIINSNRSHIYFLILFTALWISEYEMPREIKPKKHKKNNALYQIISKIDRNYQKNSIILISIMFFMSIPTGVYFLFSDYTKEFDISKEASKYISENFPEDSIFVVKYGYVANISAYLPDAKFYSLDFDDFCTFYPTKDYLENHDLKKIHDDLKDYKNIYFIDFSIKTYSESPIKLDNIIYSHSGEMNYMGSAEQIAICPFDINDLESYLSIFHING